MASTRASPIGLDVGAVTQLVDSLFRSADHPIYLINRQRSVVWINRFRLGDREIRPHRVIGKRCHELFSKRRTPCPNGCLVQRVFATGEFTSKERQVQLPDGTSCWAESRAYPIHSDAGKVELVLEMTFDISRRVEVQRRTTDQLDRLELALAALSGQQRATTGPLVGTDPRARLTQRELEVISLVARGRSNPQIADALGVTLNTVKTHVTHIFNKLGVNDRVQVALWAERIGLG